MSTTDQFPAARYQGGPCVRCGGTERYVSTRNCAARSGPCRDSRRKRYKRWATKNPDKERANHRKQNLARYGLTKTQYAELLAAQGGVCAICRKECTQLGRGRLGVDHDHHTNRVRGLLCSRCNVAIGYLRNDAQLAIRVHEYLTQYSLQEA